MAEAAINFDTHRFVEKLIGVKMPKKQAEALAEEFSTSNSTHIATKGDIEKLEIRMESLEARINAKIDRLLVQLMVGLLLVGGLVIGAVGLMFAYWG